MNSGGLDEDVEEMEEQLPRKERQRPYDDDEEEEDEEEEEEEDEDPGVERGKKRAKVSSNIACIFIRLTGST